jgi:hypothetical protein
MPRTQASSSKRNHVSTKSISRAGPRVLLDESSLESEWWDKTAPLYTDRFTTLRNPFLQAFYYEEEATLRKVLANATSPKDEPPAYIEIGSGTGRIFRQLLQKQGHYDNPPVSTLVGIDFSQEMIKQCAKNLATITDPNTPSWEIPWTLVRGDARRLDQILDQKNRNLRSNFTSVGDHDKADEMLRSRPWVIGVISVLTNLSSKDSRDMLESVAETIRPGDFVFTSSYAAEHFSSVAYDLYTNPEVEKISGSTVVAYDTAKRVYASIDEQTGRAFKSHWLSKPELAQLFTGAGLSTIQWVTLDKKPARVQQLESALANSSDSLDQGPKSILKRAPFPRGVFMLAKRPGPSKHEIH